MAISITLDKMIKLREIIIDMIFRLNARMQNILNFLDEFYVDLLWYIDNYF